VMCILKAGPSVGLNPVTGKGIGCASRRGPREACYELLVYAYARSAAYSRFALLEMRESRSPMQIFRRYLLPASHRFWAYMCAFGPGLMMIVMAMAMAMAMMLVMVIIVPEVLRQVGWLLQCQRQSFHRLRAFY